MFAMLMGAVLLIIPPSIPQDKQYVSRPDYVYMGDARVVIETYSGDMDKYCRQFGLDYNEGSTGVACTVGVGRGDKATIYMPNPCLFSDNYAQILCHEIAHTQGYRHPQQ